MQPQQPVTREKIVVLGAGFAGAYAAKKAQKASRDVDIVLIDRNNYLLFYPLLVEAGVGSIEARHVVVPIRSFLRSEQFLMAEILKVDLTAKIVRVRVIGQEAESEVPYDQLIIALGSETRMQEIKGLKEHGFTVKTLDDAIGLRDRGIRLLELANTIGEPERRRELLSCVTVGANYTGVEFAGEFYAFLLEASKAYPNVRPEEISMTVLEFAKSILQATTPKLAAWCSKTLQDRGVKILLETTITEASGTQVITNHGETLPCQTLVWAAGIMPNPLLKAIAGLPLNDHGYIDCNDDLSVKGLDGVWAIGDSATIIAPNGKPYPATAQTASREGAVAVENITSKMAGQPTKRFQYRLLGAFAAIGRKQAAADVLGLQITGFLGWLLYRGTYLMKMPTLGMKFRLLADWTTEIVFKNHPVQLGIDRYRQDRADGVSNKFYVR